MNPNALAVRLVAHSPDLLFSRDSELCPSSAELTIKQCANTSSVAVAVNESGDFVLICFGEVVWKAAGDRLRSARDDKNQSRDADDNDRKDRDEDFFSTSHRVRS